MYKQWTKINNTCILTFSILVVSTLFLRLNGQTVSVNGNIYTSDASVRYAKITFQDINDPVKTFSTTTDSLGNYQLNILLTNIKMSNNLPVKFELNQNYPNPFSNSTRIPYEIKIPSEIHITISDILGRVVRKISVSSQAAGRHNVYWDGLNSSGQKVASGIYFYRLDAGGESKVKKMIFNEGAKSPIPLTHSFISSSVHINQVVDEKLEAKTFSVRIGNEINTFPFIVSKQPRNVTIWSDTTFNYRVVENQEITVYADSLQQYIRGFGASNILAWRPDMTDSEIETAFGTDDDQLGFTILRLMLEPDKSRWYRYISTAKKAHDMDVTIIASPWHAPDNMVETVNGESRVKHDMYDEYATHLDSFVTYMANNDVPIYGVSVQNEPEYGEDWTGWTANEIFTFMKENAHAINGTNVMAPESFNFNRAYSDRILNDPVACANTDIICGHIYGSGLTSYPLAEQKGKEVWMTEYLINTDNPPSDIDIGWTGAIQTAISINNCMDANMSAYVWWYLVRYYGPIADGTYTNKGDVTKKGYVMSQYARFVRPGYYRVECNFNSSFNGLITAYKDIESSEIVIVAVNTKSTAQDQRFIITDSSVTSLTPYTTSETKDCFEEDEIYKSNDQFIFTFEPYSITTFISN
jgi:glucuronoarabinoxylan endo-1,4-beta-xylanase